MKINNFKEYIKIYGPDLSLWPDAIKKAAIYALKNNNGFQNLISEEVEFENIINLKKIIPHRVNLAQDIIARAARIPQQAKPARGFSWGFGIMSPALSFASFAVMAFIIGFAASDMQENGYTQNSQNDIIQKIFSDTGLDGGELL